MGRHAAEDPAAPSTSAPRVEGVLSPRWGRAVNAGVALLWAGIIASLVWVGAGDVQEIALRKHLAGSGVRTTGIVTERDADSRVSRGGGGGTDYFLSYRFSTPDGRALQREDVQISGDFFRAHPAGSEIAVAYDAGSPERNSPVVLLDSVGTTTTAVLAVLIFVGSGAAGLWLAHRLRRRLGGWYQPALIFALMGGLVVGLILTMTLFDLLAALIF